LIDVLLHQIIYLFGTANALSVVNI